MNNSCDICRQHNSMVPHLEIGLIGVGAVWIHHCVECGFRQIRPRLARSALEIIYGDDYFDPSKGQGFSEYGRQRQRYEREAFFLVNALHRSGHAQGRLLEVGSGLGFLLNAVSRTSPWVVEGVELSSFGAKYARERFGLTIQNSTLEDVRYPNGYFDFVVQKDLLEHVTNPRRHLEETHRIMRSRSRLWLITPNGEADIRPLRVYKASFATDVVPVMDQGHLSFFSRPQLLRLAEEVGFRCIRFRNIGLRRGLRALGFLPGGGRRQPVISRKELEATVQHRRTQDVVSEMEKRNLYWKLVSRIDREVESHHSSVRGSIPYFYYRHCVKFLDSLPAHWTVGRDFDIVLEKV